MKINSINSTNINKYNYSFKQSAVPYPEFGHAYLADDSTIEDKRESLINKISELFSPKVTKEANEIKSTIDGVYSQKGLTELTPRKQLLSVLG